jgi:Domain of unknown function (DUF4920)
MRRITPVIAVVLVVLAVGCAPMQEKSVTAAPVASSANAAMKAGFEAQTSYGAAMPAEPAVQTVADAAPQFAAMIGQQVKMSGRIGTVCQAKGCWMMLTEGELSIRVKFGSDSFFIPKDSSGNAIAYGVLEAIKMPLADAKHMAKDAGIDPDTVTEATQEFQLVATSVLIEAKG